MHDNALFEEQKKHCSYDGQYHMIQTYLKDAEDGCCFHVYSFTSSLNRMMKGLGLSWKIIPLLISLCHGQLLLQLLKGSVCPGTIPKVTTCIIDSGSCEVSCVDQSQLLPHRRVGLGWSIADYINENGLIDKRLF